MFEFVATSFGGPWIAKLGMGLWLAFAVHGGTPPGGTPTDHTTATWPLDHAGAAGHNRDLGVAFPGRR